MTPYRLIGERSIYMVRAQPGQRDAVMKSAEAKLLSIVGNRILISTSMQQVRTDAYRANMD